MRLLAALALVLLAGLLFVRSYTVPPAPDRRGGTTVFLAWPNRPLFGSPRGDCLGTPESEPAIACLIASVNRARTAGIPLLSLPFCATCHDLSQRLAQIARFGW